MNEVAVVITSYQYVNYLTKCIDSCLAQTMPCDIIVVDDASTDGSQVLLHRYNACHDNITFMRHPENMGYAAAKNTGVEEAIRSGHKFIVQLDADDALTPDSVEVRRKWFDKRPYLDLVHGVCDRWYGGTDLRGHNPKTYVHAQGRMYRASVYLRYGMYYEPLRSMADKEFVYRLGVHPNSPFKPKIKDRRIKNIVAWYRKHEAQMHRVRKLKKPQLNKVVNKVFNRRIAQLKREGITRGNTRFPRESDILRQAS